MFLKEERKLLKAITERLSRICERIEDKKDLDNLKKIAEENDKRFRAYFEHSPSGLFIADKTGRYKNVNPAASLITGYPKEELLKLTITDILPEYEHEKAFKFHQELARIGSGHLVFDYLTKKGEKKTWKLSAVKIDDNTFIGFTYDITDIKKSKAEILKEKQIAIENEFRFKALHNATFGGLAIHDKGLILECNEGLSKITGFSYEELIGMNGLLLISEETRPLVIKNINSGYEKPYEAIGVRKNGEYYPLRLEAKMIPYQGKQVRVVEFRDITESKNLENQLKQNQLSLAKSQEIAHIGSWILNVPGNKLKWSEETFRIFGVDSENFEESYEAFLKFVHPDDREKVNNAYTSSVKNKQDSYNIEHRIVKYKTKEIRYVTEKCVHEYDEKREIIRSIGTVHDITEQKETEAEIKKLTQAIEQSPVSIVITDKDGLINYVNPTFTTITGYTFKEVIGRNPKILKSGKTPVVIYKKLWKTIVSGKIWKGELLNKKKNGELYWEAVTISAIKNSDSEVSGYLGLKEDISEIKKALEEQAKFKEHINQNQKIESIGRLAGGVAHDFNNMLSVILGHSEILLEKLTENSIYSEDLKIIRNTALKSADLTKQLLAFARKQPSEPKSTNVNENLTSLFKMLKRLIGEDIKLEYKFEKNIENIKIDPVQLDQIIINLCINAKDAIKENGLISILTKQVKVTEKKNDLPLGKYVTIEIADNGCGISKKEMEKIFEPFYTTKEVRKGTGLGLSTVYGIVKQNNGFIRVYSNLGTGTTFVINFPVYAGEKNEEQLFVKTSESIRDKVVLVIEDEESILSMLKSMLEKLGMTVFAKSSASEAIKIAKEQKIDLLLTDVIMPKINGRKLSESISEIIPDIKILFMSGYTANILDDQGIKTEKINYIQKPFTFATITDKIAEVLNQ